MFTLPFAALKVIRDLSGSLFEVALRVHRLKELKMDWVEDFYSKQTDWLGLAERWAQVPINVMTGRRAKAVNRLIGPEPKRILELGCGSGIIAGRMAYHGHSVVAVDIVAERVASAKRIADSLPSGRMTALHGDFFNIELPGRFDVVCYFDGFGIGADADQRRLLKRIKGWLEPEGCALIDVYSPYAKRNGVVVKDFDALSRTVFDPYSCRLLNSIWPQDGDESQAVTQSLRCYSPADFQLLLEGSGLVIQTIEPYATADDEEIVPLDQAMLYLAMLTLEG